jgi:hypothetical protein
MAAFRGTEHSVVIIHRDQWPEFQVSQRHGAARECLVGASRMDNPHLVASPTRSFAECTLPTGFRLSPEGVTPPLQGSTRSQVVGFRSPGTRAERARGSRPVRPEGN